MKSVDVIVVGSGASAVHVAYPLVEAGLNVRMLDYGNRDSVYAPLIPAAPFGELRGDDPNQHRYFLGDRFEGIGFGHTGAGAQLTPPRQFVCQDADRLTPVDSKTFFPIESLARGGLAGAWGAGCPPFADADFLGMPLDRKTLNPHYQTVAERIGVSGARDQLLQFFGELESLQPAVEVDTNGQSILRGYQSRRARLNRKGFFIGQPRLAMLSRDHRGRLANPYHDMDFWSDQGKSVYRPQWTLDELSRHDNFEYCSARFIREFSEDGDNSGVEVTAQCDDGTIETHRCKRLVLAAGTLGTARIVLRSLKLYDRRLPLVCNPHTYAAMLNLRMIGKAASGRRHSLAQLCFVHAPDGVDQAATVGHVFSYRSLHTFRLARDSPLPLTESVQLFRRLMSALTILIIQHEDRPTDTKYCRLNPEDADRLEVGYGRSTQERQAAERTETNIVARFRSLGCVCLRRLQPGDAASIHYAGTFPMANDDRHLTTDEAGRLRPTRRIHLADGSVFPGLPSRGLTFTMMANADRIGREVAALFQSGA